MFGDRSEVDVGGYCRTEIESGWSWENAVIDVDV
jgi:hypothetical protein